MELQMRQINPHTRDYFVYASWVADPVVLLGSYDSYAYLKPKDHKKQQVYIYKNVRKE